jgi:hypothetical protein
MRAMRRVMLGAAVGMLLALAPTSGPAAAPCTGGRTIVEDATVRMYERADGETYVCRRPSGNRTQLGPGRYEQVVLSSGVLAFDFHSRFAQVHGSEGAEPDHAVRALEVRTLRTRGVALAPDAVVEPGSLALRGRTVVWREGGAERSLPLDSGPAPPATHVVDPAAGAYRGLRLGDATARVRVRFGARRCGGPIHPLGERRSIGGPYSSDYRTVPSRPFRACVLRFPRLAVMVERSDGLIELVTTHPRARTSRGVRIGSTVATVERLYPEARCEPSRDTGDVDSSAAVCSVDVEPWRELHFGVREQGGPDRVVSIWLLAKAPEGLAR